MLLSGLLVSCGSSRTVKSQISKKEYNSHKSYSNKKKIGKIIKSEEPEKNGFSEVGKAPQRLDAASRIVEYAKNYMGTKYQYGGMSEKGMDCSGLVYLSFLNAADIFLPRSSREMSKQGTRVGKNDIQKGDLVFFKTNPRRNVINHIGIVVKNDHGKINFIHASTSHGVMISAIDDLYWKKVFVEARRVL